MAIDALDALVVVTVVVTGAALIGYRLLGKKGIRFPLPGVSPLMEMIPKSSMMILISLLVLSSSLYIILSGHYDDGSQKWAFGTVGSIMGFWLK